MFILTTVSDLISVPPHEHGKAPRIAVEDKINEKYANRVIQKIGLCVCMYDLLIASEGLIGHGTGDYNVQCEFRLLVFRPFKGEVILGKIESSNEEYIRVSTDFFADIRVKPHMLFDGTEFDAKEQVWVWKNEGDDLYFDVGEVVRIRVEEEEWHDQSPTRPPLSEESNSDIDAKISYLIWV